MNEVDRLQLIINELIMSIPEFAKSIDVTKDTIYRILDGRSKLTTNVKGKIFEVYKNINRTWFETGEGEMFTWKGKTEILKESGAKYEKTCPLCSAKDKEIADLKSKLIESQQLYIELLKEVSVLKGGASG